MKVGIVPPVPMEPVLAGGHQAVNLWTRFYLSGALPDAPLAGAAPAAGETPWTQFLAAAPEALGLDEVLLPSPGTPPSVARTFGASGASAVPARTFRFPFLRNLDKTREAIADLCAAYGADPGVLGSLVEQWFHARNSLKRLDALQGRNATFPSAQYLASLAKVLDPGGDLEGLKREVEARILENQGLARESWVRIAVVGIPPRRPELWSALEDLRAVVVYDEWGTECNVLHPVHDLSALWHHCSLPYGLRPRQERLLKELSSRKVHGVLWGAEGLADSLREESFFRSALPFPLHTHDNSRDGALDATEAESLARFVAQCAPRRGTSP